MAKPRRPWENGALVTGGDQGLGAAIHDRLLQLFPDPDRVVTVPGSALRGKPLDDIARTLDEMMNRRGPFDVVVNNFGINHLSWIGDTPASDADILHCNVMVPYWVINTLVKLHNGPARVLNIASQTYRVPQRCTALYAASKAALVQMTKVMARELASKGWVINVLAPGKIWDTDMSRLTDAQVRELRRWTDAESTAYAESLVPMRRFTSREEVANLAIEVLGLQPYVNGAVIDAMGGV